MNEIRNEDCCKTLEYLKNTSQKVNLILTSPPYNNSRHCKTEYSLKHNIGRYTEYNDNKSTEEYIDFIVMLFNQFDEVLQTNGTILWNISYSGDTEVKSDIAQTWLCIADIIKRSPFTVVDHIVWKKKNALPNNTSPNKLTRICESVFVFARKNETKSFVSNKKIVSISKRGQKFYENKFNFIEAANNDFRQNLNKATFSVEFVNKLLDMYARDGSYVYDPFGGIGTTAIACKKRNMPFILSELSKEQCELARKRLAEVS